MKRKLQKKWKENKKQLELPPSLLYVSAHHSCFLHLFSLVFMCHKHTPNEKWTKEKKKAHELKIKTDCWVFLGRSVAPWRPAKLSNKHNQDDSIRAAEEKMEGFFPLYFSLLLICSKFFFFSFSFSVFYW